jgi:predicted dehydrogenase
MECYSGGHMSDKPLSVAVVGAGYWGINHVRAFASLPQVRLVAVCDENEAALQRAARLAPTARLERSFQAVLDDRDIEALVLVTPARLHADHACAALAAGKHVLVEKPLALTVADAERVVEAAARAGRTAMVGHLMLYHPAIARLRELIGSGELGNVYYMYSQRVNLGQLRRDENALWSLAPHDISIILWLLGEEPVEVGARGQAYLQPGVEDVVFLHLRFPDRKIAQVQLSWLDPRKERRLTVVGSRKMVEFDDVHPTEKLRIYDKGFDRPPEFTQYAEYLTIRQGDVHIPRVGGGEPLALECAHFVECCRRGTRPLSDVASGLAVVRVLARATEALRAGRPDATGQDMT